MNTIELTIYDYVHGKDRRMTLPARWEICCECGGDGKHSQALGSFSPEQLDDDPEFAEAYFAGEYDQQCSTCRGSGKVAVPNAAACSPEQRRFLAQYQRFVDEEALAAQQSRAERAAEQRMGC
jgi:DnaJ-class molecular chaperone